MKSLWLWLGFSAAILVVVFTGLQALTNGPVITQGAFDATRAQQTIVELIPDNKPHPLGSAENRRIRRLIENKISALGFEPQLQKTVLCSAERSACAAVENVFAIKPATMPDAGAILVSAHYDSTLAGPGAGDDLAGVAAMLEVMRQISDETYENEIIFLFADAEEAGLWGAKVFAEQHPIMERVDLVLNLEARGVTGPSAMFETSTDNRNLISLFSRAVSRPFANSLTYEVYRKMPNDTDMSVYKSAGAAGLNFAFSGGVSLYHTSRDDPAHLNKRSLTHHGHNVLEILRVAANTPMDNLEASGDAVYFDLFGVKLIHWPAALNLPLVVFSLCLIIFTGIKAQAFRMAATLRSLTVFFTIIAGLGVIGWFLTFPLAVWPAAAMLDHPHPWPGRIALITSSLLAPLLIAPKLAGQTGHAPVLFTTWIMLGLVSLIFALVLPGAAYVTLAPAMIFAVVAAIESFAKPRSQAVIAGHAGFIAAVYMAAYHFLAFEVILGFHFSHVKALLLFMAAVTSAPLIIWHMNKARQIFAPAIVLTTIIVVAAITGAIMPAYTADRPRSMSFSYEQIESLDGAQDTHWRLHTFGADADAIASATGFPESDQPYRLYNVYELNAYFKSAKNFALPAPAITIVNEEQQAQNRILQATLRPGRNGVYYGIAFQKDAGLIRLTVNETDLLTAQKLEESATGALVMFLGMGDQTISFELETGAAPLKATLYEVSPLPDAEETKDLLQMRPDTAVPSNLGDYTEVQKRVVF